MCVYAACWMSVFRLRAFTELNLSLRLWMLDKDDQTWCKHPSSSQQRHVQQTVAQHKQDWGNKWSNLLLTIKLFRGAANVRETWRNLHVYSSCRKIQNSADVYKFMCNRKPEIWCSVHVFFFLFWFHEYGAEESLSQMLQCESNMAGTSWCKLTVSLQNNICITSHPDRLH